VRAVGARIYGLLPRGWVDAAWQFALFYLAYTGYQVVRGVTDGSREVAVANAERLIDIERSLGSYFEPGLQGALLDHASWLIDFANFMYLNSHFVITTGFLAWLYLCRNRHFYFVRNMFMVAMALGLVGYALYPTAPPRLLEGEGFTDTIALFTGVAQDDQTASLLVNQYAAVPSMHIAFSLMVAVPAAALSRHAAARYAWWSYPLVVLFVIVATGNHFWLDAAAGAAVACMAAVAARVLARVRPGLWAWPDAGERAPARTLS
jgi:hypothetical protein